MARTRTSDHTFKPRHAKPLVYASLLAAWVAGVLALPTAARGAELRAADPALREAQAPGDAAPCVPCQVLSLPPAQVAALPAALREVSIAVRVAPGDAAAATAVAGVKQRGARVALHVVGVPADQDPVLALDVATIIVEPPAMEIESLAFELKRALAAARGQHPTAVLLVAASDTLTAQLRERGVAPYVDVFVAPATPIASAADLLQPGPDGTFIRVLPDDMAGGAAIAAAAAATIEWVSRGLVAAAGRALSCGDGRSMATFLNAQTLDLVGISRACPPSSTVTSDMPGVAIERIEVADVSAFRARAGSGGDRFAEGVTVGAARALTVEEIVARHQAAAARQAAAVRTDIATGTLTLTFEAPVFVAPITIASQTTIFRDEAGVDLQQADIRVNGVLFTAKDGVPRLPIIEPERVAAVPLTITLTSIYRYRLDGRDTIDGRPCYVVGFSPRADGALFSGRAWIDAETFAMARVSAVQTGLKGPIVASEQTDTFTGDGGGHWLLARSDIRQTYEGASVRTPIHRLLAIDRHEINAPDFASRRAAAYASTDVILRDTPGGFRYLKREAGSRQPSAGSGQPQAGSGELGALRTIAPLVTTIRTLAAGVIVDPNISVPLPFAGLSYVNFDLFHTGTQFSGFFGGSYAQAAFSAPSLGGTRWQLAGRAFAIATSYNDRAFVNGREIYTRDIRQRPAQAAVWVLRPIAARAAVRVEYDWDYNRFERNEATDPAFVIPRNQNAHTLRAGLDVQYAGWQASAWASQSVRIGWRRWGIPGSSEDADPRGSYQRYGANLLRTASMSPRVATRVETAFTGGTNLDRFSRVAFGSFDNRLHGYPSALIRYDR